MDIPNNVVNAGSFVYYPVSTTNGLSDAKTYEVQQVTIIQGIRDKDYLGTKGLVNTYISVMYDLREVSGYMGNFTYVGNTLLTGISCDKCEEVY